MCPPCGSILVSDHLPSHFGWSLTGGSSVSILQDCSVGAWLIVSLLKLRGKLFHRTAPLQPKLHLTCDSLYVVWVSLVWSRHLIDYTEKFTNSCEKCSSMHYQTICDEHMSGLMKIYYLLFSLILLLFFFVFSSFVLLCFSLREDKHVFWVRRNSTRKVCILASRWVCDMEHQRL